MANFALVTYVILSILSHSWLENADAQPKAGQSSWEMLENLRKGLENLHGKIDNQTTLLNKLEAKVEMQATCLNNSEANSDMLTILLNNSQSLSSEVRTPGTIKVVKLSDDFHYSCEPRGFVEGIIAGTDAGVFVISLDSRDQRIISTNFSTGVAFEWITRKVYWAEWQVGIKRANLDGTAEELLIPDASTLYGLAVDPITGNFYYGVRSLKREIRVCTNSAKNCVVIASGADLIGEKVFDIALNPSEGIMFWSDSKKGVTRANMDGTNATIIISENIYGLHVDGISYRFYAANLDNRTVATYNTNGSVREAFLNVVVPPADVAVDGDTVYFCDFDGRSVYSVAPGGILSFVAKTTGKVRHIALYGRNKVLSRPNPCENSPCPNVCVLNPESYTCL